MIILTNPLILIVRNDVPLSFVFKDLDAVEIILLLLVSPFMVTYCFNNEFICIFISLLLYFIFL